MCNGESPGRTSWLRRVRLENPLGHGNFLWAVGNAVVDSLWRGSRPFVRWVVICTQMAFYGTQLRRYGRCCMYGPNYVKLSRFFAVQLLSMCIGHYAALPPVRSDPHWSHSHAITASIRLALAETRQHPLLATQTSTVPTTTCLGYLHPHTRTMRPSTASPICL
jgi:hypothetical protein